MSEQAWTTSKCLHKEAAIALLVAVEDAWKQRCHCAATSHIDQLRRIGKQPHFPLSLCSIELIVKGTISSLPWPSCHRGACFCQPTSASTISSLGKQHRFLALPFPPPSRPNHVTLLPKSFAAVDLNSAPTHVGLTLLSHDEPRKPCVILRSWGAFLFEKINV